MLFALALLVAAVALLLCAVAARARATALPRSPVVEDTPLQTGARTAHAVDDAILIEREHRAFAAGLLELASSRKVRLVAETSGRGRAAVGVELGFAVGDLVGSAGVVVGVVVGVFESVGDLAP